MRSIIIFLEPKSAKPAEESRNLPRRNPANPPIDREEID